MNRKIIFSFALLVLTICLVDAAYAADTPSIGRQICSIRWLFCGAVRVTLCAITVITVGFMILAGRMTWGSALVILCGMLLFANAEVFAMMFTSNPRCFCAPVIAVVNPIPTYIPTP